MSKIVWDAQGTKQYELGVDHGVLYTYNKTTSKWEGVAWNGLTSVTESPDGAEETELWADNIKYGSMRSAEKFSGSIEAYTYPDEFEPCDGIVKIGVGMGISQQKRAPFCLCYRTNIGNDLDSEAGYRLHLVYNATCTPSEKAYETINDSPDAITFSWDFDTTPINVTGYKPTSHITFDSTDFKTEGDRAKLTELEDILYGTDAVEADAEHNISAHEATIAELPMPDDLVDLMTRQ